MTKIIINDEDGIQSFLPEEYAALWGCDPCYDHSPNLSGDGYLFYNFSSQGDDPEFLAKFIPAIERTIQSLTGREVDNSDIQNLNKLKEICEARLSRDLDNFTKAYITAALWSTNDESTPEGGVPLDDNYTEDDIAPSTLAEMIKVCKEFQRKFEHFFTWEFCLNKSCSPVERAGHDLWLTRNGHGCGFLDGDWAEPAATAMNEEAEKLGNTWLYVGDNGKIYS